MSLIEGKDYCELHKAENHLHWRKGLARRVHSIMGCTQERRVNLSCVPSKARRRSHLHAQVGSCDGTAQEETTHVRAEEQEIGGECCVPCQRALL